MKVLLIGAGGQGAPCASILARDPAVSAFTLADLDEKLLQKCARKIPEGRMTLKKLDASDPGVVADAAAGMDVIIDLVSTEFTLPVMKGALKAGVHYVNSAFSRAMWDFDMRQGKRPKLHAEFAAAGKTALLGCGMSAGYTNVLVRLHADRMDRLESVKIRLGRKDTSCGPGEDILMPWNPGWNPRIAFLDFVNSTTVFEEGQFREYEKPFSGIETWVFPEPAGPMQVALHAHEEPYSMPTTFASKGLRHCDFKYYVNAQVAPMVALGFGRVPAVTVKGGTVDPLDVLLALVPRPAANAANPDPEELDAADRTKHVFIMMELTGIQDGKRVRHLITIPDMNKPRRKIQELFGATAVNVALPAVIGAKRVLDGEKRGVIFPEELDPEKFIATLHETGYPGRWQTVTETL